MRKGYELMFVLWLLGPTSSGKTKIATELLMTLREKKVSVVHYDGDEIRELFGDSINFTVRDRHKVVGTIVHLANKACDAGINVIVSALTANEDTRKFVTENVRNLIIAYVKCSIDECIRRDPKGLYNKAKEGKINTLIGFNEEYPEPENPDIILETEKYSPQEIVEYIEKYLSKNVIYKYNNRKK